ncbi:MAG: hypothetical protein SynsKO_40730 [Synoicihabitans sp.]
MFRSLKWQVALGAFVILAATIAAVGGSIYWWIERELNQRLEDSLRLAARSTASHITLEGSFLELYHDKLAQLEAGNQFLTLQVLNRRGGIIYGPKQEYSEIEYDEPSIDEGEALFVADFEGEPALWLDLTFRPVDEYALPGSPPTDYRARVIVVRSLSELQATLAGLRQTILASVLIGAGGGAALLALLALFSVRPIDKLATSINRIDHDHLSPLAAIDRLPQELEPVMEEINTLMERLRLAFDRERTFSSNVAHELRTPLTGLRSTLEVVLSAPPSAESSRQAQETCLDIVRQTQVLVEKLLRLTRLQSGLPESEIQPLELREAVEESWSLFAENAEQRGLSVSFELPDALHANVNVDLFLVVLNNLLENAANYCPEGGELVISLLHDENDRPVLRVSNTVDNLSRDEVDKVFDAFWRKDASRSATGVHAGLGLSISRAMAQQFDAQLTAILQEEKQPAHLEFTLRMNAV